MAIIMVVIRKFIGFEDGSCSYVMRYIGLMDFRGIN